MLYVKISLYLGSFIPVNNNNLLTHTILTY